MRRRRETLRPGEEEEGLMCAFYPLCISFLFSLQLSVTWLSVLRFSPSRPDHGCVCVFPPLKAWDFQLFQIKDQTMNMHPTTNLTINASDADEKLNTVRNNVGRNHTVLIQTSSRDSRKTNEYTARALPLSYADNFSVFVASSLWSDDGRNQKLLRQQTMSWREKKKRTDFAYRDAGILGMRNGEKRRR